MSRLLKRFGLAGLAFFAIKGLAWLALAAAGTALSRCAPAADSVLRPDRQNGARLPLELPRACDA